MTMKNECSKYKATGVPCMDCDDHGPFNCHEDNVDFVDKYFDTDRPSEIWMENCDDEWEGPDCVDSSYLFDKYQSREWFTKLIDADYKKWKVE